MAAVVAVAVVAVVADGWPVPAASRARLRLITAGVGAVVWVPFVPAWRYTDRPDAAGVPRRMSAALRAVRAAAER